MADRDMSGSLSKNLRKEKPSHAGSIVIEGRKYWLNGWVKDGEKGKFLSLSAKPAEDAPTTRSRSEPEWRRTAMQSPKWTDRCQRTKSLPR